MFRALILALLCSACAASARAQASQRPALHWSRGSDAQDCIDPRALAQQVVALTGPVLVEPTGADLSIEGHIQRARDGELTARIVATKANGAQLGERLLKHRGDCRALDTSLAFVIAMLINPDLALDKLPASLVELGVEGPAPEQALLAELEQEPPRPAALPTRSAHTLSEPPPVPTDSSAAPIRPLELQLGISTAGGELPRASLGGYLSLAWLVRHWFALEAQARFALPLSNVHIDEFRGVDARVFDATLSFCPRHRVVQRLLLEACLGPEVLWTQAKGSGFVTSRSALLTNYAVQLSATLGVQLTSHVSVRLRGFARALLNQSELTYTRGEQTFVAFELQRVSGGGNLGMAYAF